MRILLAITLIILAMAGYGLVFRDTKPARSPSLKELQAQQHPRKPHWWAEAEQALAEQKTPYGVPFSTKARFKIGNTRVDIPVGYLHWAKPTDEMVVSIVQVESIRFVFWMPDRSIVLRKGAQPMLFPHGPEPGHEYPSDKQFIVEITGLQFDVQAREPETLSARTMIRNTSQSSFNRGIAENIYGLTRIDRDPRFELSGPYVKDDSDDLAAIFLCTAESSPLSNPLCTGSIHFREDDLGFQIAFSRRDFAQWRQAAEAARDMALTWREKQ